MPAKTVSICYFVSRNNWTYRDFGNSTWPPQSNDLETQGDIDVGSLMRLSEYETASVAQTERNLDFL